MNKACPVVLRYKDNQLELLAFKHPEAGNQLVKGNINKGEPLDVACVRELAEESGIQGQVVRQLGVWEPGFKNQVWGFCLMHYETLLPDTWEFDTHDDGGHVFSFFWQPLNASLKGEWNRVYSAAFEYIKTALR